MSLLSVQPMQLSALFPPTPAAETAGSIAFNAPETAGSIASSFSGSSSLCGSSSGGGSSFNAVA